MQPTVPLWMRGEFTTRERSSASAIVRRDFAPDFDRLGLIGAADRTAEEILATAEKGLADAGGLAETDPGPGGDPDELADPGDAGELAGSPPGELHVVRAPRLLPSGSGRGPLALLPTSAGPGAVVRPYRRGGLPAHLAERHYMLGHRAFREFIVTERLRRAGVPVPMPLAAVQSRAVIGYRAALVTRHLSDAEPAPEALGPRASAGRRAAMRSMGRGAGRLHAAGGWHADLNAGNFLIPRARGRPANGVPPDPAIILDLDRGRVLSSPLPDLLARWNLRRLRRSLRKLELGAALEAWDAFQEGYELGLEEG